LFAWSNFGAGLSSAAEAGMTGAAVKAKAQKNSETRTAQRIVIPPGQIALCVMQDIAQQAMRLRGRNADSMDAVPRGRDFPPIVPSALFTF
jgi:hypothetical protein